MRRGPDNKLIDPTPWGELKPLAGGNYVAPVDYGALSDEIIARRLYDPSVSILDRQPYIHEATRRENKKKTYARLDKAGFTGSHRRLTNEGDPHVSDEC